MPHPRLLPATLATAAAFAALSALTPARAQLPNFLDPKPARPLGAPTPAPQYRQINWDVLIPPGWDGMKEFRSADLARMDDGDPRAAELLKKMRAAWDKAPVNMALVGQAVRIAGYVVPLEEGADGMKEFLLVPYYGACIHSPPPPANQIIHVLPRVPAKGLNTITPVWVSGVLGFARNDSTMGTSSWRLAAVNVQPYADAATASPLR